MRPKIVYHGSPVGGLREIRPDNQRVRDPYEGPVVFASEEMAMAAMFLGPRPDDRWSLRGCFDNTYYMLIADEERFRREDRGGHLYEIPVDHFERDVSRGLETEWICRRAVRPVACHSYNSALDAMLVHQVNVYFIDHRFLRKFRHAIFFHPFHARELLAGLVPENKKAEKIGL